MRSERDANLSLVPATRATWADPSRCKRPARNTRARLLYLATLAVAILGAAYLGV
jgi:hypothetical protein